MTAATTDLKLAKERVREREEILNAIFSQAADGIVLIDIETHRFTEFNDAACTTLGYTREEFGRLTLADLQAALTREQVAKALAQMAANGGGAFEIQHRRKDGAILDVSVSNRLIHLHGRDYMAAVWHDVTERKQAEAKLRQSEQRFRDFASATADWWFWEMDADLRFSYFSENAATATGRKVADLIGRRRKDLASAGEAGEQEKWARHFDDLEHHRVIKQFEYRLVNVDGSERWISVSGVPIFAPDGDFLGYRGTGNDISERKLIGAELDRHRDHLEDLVAERTAQLEAANKVKPRTRRRATSWPT
jgi:PAS domain S-box-containing protein